MPPEERTVAESLVERIASLPSTLPAEIETAARLHLLDAIGVGLAASRRGPARGLRPATPGKATVLGAATGAGPAEAALINGTLIHSLEYDDTHTGSVMHGSSVLAPAVLAMAEDTGADGRDVVRAFALGWEVLVRLGLASPSGFQRVGFQGTSVAGPIAGALAAALVSGLDPARLIDVAGVAASFSAGNFTFLAGGTSSKAAQAGIAAQAAVSAVQLVRGGITGASTVFEGERGFFGLYARDASAAERFRESVAGLGSHWYLADAAFKGLPCCHFLHPFVEAIGRLGLAEGEHRRLRRVLCRVPEGQEHVIALPWDRKQSPVRADEARWSLPYVVALRAVRGRVGLDDFTGEPDAEVVRFASRMEWEPWTDSGYPTVFPAELEAEWDDGTTRVVRVEDVDGNGTRPWGAGRVAGKFRQNCADAGIPADAADAAVRGVLDGDTVQMSAVRALSDAAGS
ncbi:MmgE/PrpD family protein [Prauserella cavernicola]|uniref:MmgE/PrpD family protein n=1 Tax=Prauserella cavernicola TaxID=2800127 RepID=A0A934V3G2_9PSEU|nr:MmgE/PrpD family protein [Prauserella cavernicola]MBK1783639.1 MmgE/PrpD family protein [Prauserella cavernicola]